MALNSTSSESWLNAYRGQTGIQYPFLYDAGGTIHQLYQVGSQFGNIPPTYLVIDRQGIVRSRTDDMLNQTPSIIALIRTLL